MGNNGDFFDEINKPMNFKDKVVIGLFVIGIPLLLTIILSIVGDIDQKRTQERLSNKPQTTWYDVMTPEERHRYGLDRMPAGDASYTPASDASERFQRVLKEGNKENQLIDKLSSGDYKDYYDYYDGPEGENGDVDFHDIEDYFGGSRD